MLREHLIVTFPSRGDEIRKDEDGARNQREIFCLKRQPSEEIDG